MSLCLTHGRSGPRAGRGCRWRKESVGIAITELALFLSRLVVTALLEYIS